MPFVVGKVYGHRRHRRRRIRVLRTGWVKQLDPPARHYTVEEIDEAGDRVGSWDQFVGPLAKQWDPSTATEKADAREQLPLF